MARWVERVVQVVVLVVVVDVGEGICVLRY